jgi:hypothetical protein
MKLKVTFSINILIFFHFFCSTESSFCNCIFNNHEHYFCDSDFAVKLNVKSVEIGIKNEIRYGVQILRVIKGILEPIRNIDIPKVVGNRISVINETGLFKEKNPVLNKTELFYETNSDMNESRDSVLNRFVKNRTNEHEKKFTMKKFIFKNKNSFIYIYTFDEDNSFYFASNLLKD